ncbi:MAG: putative ATP-dependent helicase [Prokaryotic dsDNA virus sp.]|nr:MAG: putative ATP-dependent helicase [Prokaryotic dsDNA virus sp.]|tara:strand:+ start:36558 stop:38345 length:1788 start_codon:yes stop_codon:yes gene_type:complete
MQEEGVFIRHDRCDECNSSDANAIYTNNSYCFSCGNVVHFNKYNPQPEEEEEPQLSKSPLNSESKEYIKNNTGTDPKGYRGIRKDISNKFKVRYEYSTEDGSVVKTYYPCTVDHQLSGYKTRVHPKDFTQPVGEVGKGCELFGQAMFKQSNADRIIIAAGEVDCMSIYQIMSDYQAKRGYEPIPVVSSTVGETGSHKQIAAQYEFFSKFSKIIICPDQDEAGLKAAEKVARALPKGKVFIMTLPEKDANEMLSKGMKSEFINAYFKASAFVPSGIVGSDKLLDKMLEAATVPKIPLPSFMHNLQRLMAGGIPLGVTVCLGSASGQGKSTFVEEITYYMIFNSPHKVGVVSLESDCAQYGNKILSRHIGKKIDLIEDNDEKIAYLNSLEVQEKANELFRFEDGSPRLHLIEERDGSIESMQELIMQLIISCDCKVIILDPLQDILDGIPFDEQSEFMRWVKGAMKSHGVTFILVNHIRKSGGGNKANSAGADIFEEDFHGSSSIFKSSACNLLFTRNKEHTNPYLRNVTRMKMTKCRWSGRTDPLAGEFFYCNETHKLYDLEDYLELNPHLAEMFEEVEEDEEEDVVLNRFGKGER